MASDAESANPYALTCTVRLPLHSGYVYGASNWGNLLATGGYNESVVYVSRLDTGERVATVESSSSVLCVKWVGADGWLVAGNQRGSFAWHYATKQRIEQVGADNWVRAIAASPCGKYVCTGADDERVRLYKVTDPEPLWTCHLDASWVHSVALAEHHLVVGSRKDNVVLLELEGDLPLSEVPAEQICFVPKRSHETKGWVAAVAVSEDGSVYAYGGGDNTVTVRSVETGDLLAAYDEHSHTIRSLVFSPDGACVISGSYDKSIRVFGVTGHVESTSLWSNLEAHKAVLETVALTDDKTGLLSSGDDGDAVLWALPPSLRGTRSLIAFLGATRCDQSSVYRHLVCNDLYDRNVLCIVSDLLLGRLNMDIYQDNT